MRLYATELIWAFTKIFILVFCIHNKLSSNRSVLNAINTPYSKMAADLYAYKLALVASFKIKYSFEF